MQPIFRAAPDALAIWRAVAPLLRLKSLAVWIWWQRVGAYDELGHHGRRIAGDSLRRIAPEYDRAKDYRLDSVESATACVTGEGAGLSTFCLCRSNDRRDAERGLAWYGT